MASDPKLNSTRRLLAAALAGVALLATGWFAIATAGASSGGVGSASPAGSAEQRPDGRGSAKYERLWTRVSARERRWAHRTSQCESGGNPKAIGGGGRYRGAFQFMRSTWKSSPRSPGGDPIVYPYRTQAVVAVLLKRRDGAGHWPVCG
jgi:hypothetical protein